MVVPSLQTYMSVEEHLIWDSQQKLFYIMDLGQNLAFTKPWVRLTSRQKDSVHFHGSTRAMGF